MGGELSNKWSSWKDEELAPAVRFGEHRLLSGASKLLTIAYFCGDQVQHKLNLHSVSGIAMAVFPFQIKKKTKTQG